MKVYCFHLDNDEGCRYWTLRYMTWCTSIEPGCLKISVFWDFQWKSEAEKIECIRYESQVHFSYSTIVDTLRKCGPWSNKKVISYNTAESPARWDDKCVVYVEVSSSTMQRTELKDRLPLETMNSTVAVMVKHVVYWGQFNRHLQLLTCRCIYDQQKWIQNTTRERDASTLNEMCMHNTLPP